LNRRNPLIGPIAEDEVKRLKFELGLGNGPKIVKRALQDLCGFYEAGRALRDASDVRQLIHSHLDSKDVLVRRWALKALGLIGNPDDSHRIVNRLKVEGDYEAITWGTAALFKSAGDKSAQEVCASAGLDSDKPLMLAARLYASDDWVKNHAKDVSVSIDDDPLTLKWAIFLAGYGRAPEDLFDPKHRNDTFLGELNTHDTPEVAEYSVWALWERPEYDSTHLSIPADQALLHPENMRKWLYRLICKSPDVSRLDTDTVKTLRINDRSPAIEGLARGIADDRSELFDASILEWAYVEQNNTTRAVLVEAMARRSDRNVTMAEFVLAEFMEALPGSILRQRLLAAASGTRLARQMNRIAAEQTLQAQGMLQYGDVNQYVILGDVMSNSNKLSVGRDFSAQTVALGDMIKSANSAVQKIAAERVEDQEVLNKVLAYLEAAEVSAEAKAEAFSAVAAAAEEPSKSNKTRLLDAFRAIGKGISNVGNIGGGYASILELITSWQG